MNRPESTVDLKIEQADREIKAIALVLSGSTHGYDRVTLKKIQMHYVEIKKLWATQKNEV